MINCIITVSELGEDYVITIGGSVSKVNTKMDYRRNFECYNTSSCKQIHVYIDSDYGIDTSTIMGSIIWSAEESNIPKGTDIIFHYAGANTDISDFLKLVESDSKYKKLHSCFNIRFNLSRISYHKNNIGGIDYYIRIILGSCTGIAIDSRTEPYRKNDR